MSSELSARQWQALQELVADGTLSAEQAAAVRTRLAAAGAGDDSAGARGWLVETAGYLGGALTFAGGALLVGLSWEDLSRAGRVAVLAAVTVLLAAAAVAIGGGPRAVRAMAGEQSTVRRRVVSVLLAAAAGTAALAGGTAVDDHGLLVGSVCGLVLAAAGYLLLPNLPVLLTAGVLSALAGMGVADELTDGSTLWMGVALVAVGACWAALGLSGRLPHRRAAVVVGGVVALVGAQLPLGDADTTGWAYLLTLLVAVGCLAGYLLDRTVLLLALGVVGMTLVVSEAVADWTGGAAGGAAAVLAAGAVLLLGSGLALRLHRRGRDDAPADGSSAGTG